MTDEFCPTAEGSIFCPSLPEPYEGLLRAYRKGAVKVERALPYEFLDTNHAAADAEHALRAAILALWVRG